MRRANCRVAPLTGLRHGPASRAVHEPSSESVSSRLTKTWVAGYVGVTLGRSGLASDATSRSIATPSWRA